MWRHIHIVYIAALATIVATAMCPAQDAAVAKKAPAEPAWLRGNFRWTVGPPLIAPAERSGETCYSVKDPSVVRHDGKWHLFCTIRGQKRSHQIEYVSLADWSRAKDGERRVLSISDGYYCAPQVFYFTPHRKWYLVYQAPSPDRRDSIAPAYSTTSDLADFKSWSKPKFFFEKHPDNVTHWIDFWVICDDTHAHLFFTSLNGQMWRSQTRRDKFPHDWSRPEVVVRGDIFEASHTYKLKGMDRYLTVVEAQRGGRRYYKAYLADRLAGEWRPLADTWEEPFAAATNVRDTAGHWTDSFSHGELIRAGHDERLEIDPHRLQFVFQGVTDEQIRGKKYGEIPWRLGLLTLD